MTQFRAWLVAALLALASANGGAHHSFSAVYDGRQVVTIEGVVTEFRFVNPHATISIDVTDQSGKVVPWVVELAGRLNLGDVGWTAESVKPGERVTVSGNPTHSGPQSHRIFFRRLVRADGTELQTANDEREDEVEENRRQRARQREQNQQK